MTYNYARDLMAQRSDMLWWLKQRIVGADSVIDKMNYSQLKEGISNAYEGGWPEFLRVYGTAPERTEPTNTDPQLTLRAVLTGALGRAYPIAACHEIVRVDAYGDEIYLVLRVINEVERGTRLIQHSANIRRIVFEYDFDTDRYVQNPAATLEVPDTHWNDAGTYVNSYLPVTTPEKYADKFWQHHECYRPGNDKAPRDGCYGPTRKDSRHEDYVAFKTTIKEVS